MEAFNCEHKWLKVSHCLISNPVVTSRAGSTAYLCCRQGCQKQFLLSDIRIKKVSFFCLHPQLYNFSLFTIWMGKWFPWSNDRSFTSATSGYRSQCQIYQLRKASRQLAMTASLNCSRWYMRSVTRNVLVTLLICGTEYSWLWKFYSSMYLS